MAENGRRLAVWARREGECAGSLARLGRDGCEERVDLDRDQLGAGRQVIITAVDRAPLETAWGEKPLSLFHVEQGVLTSANKMA